MFDYLHSRGFKCSTNITPLVTSNSLDETGNVVPYGALSTGLALNPPAFLNDPTPKTPPEFVGLVSYGLTPARIPFHRRAIRWRRRANSGRRGTTRTSAGRTYRHGGVSSTSTC